MSGMHHQTELLLVEMGSLANFLPGLGLNYSPP
jgi:hypothetical protein